MSDNREKLEDERWKLMNSFGLNPSQDGLVRDRIAAIDQELSQRETPTERIASVLEWLEQFPPPIWKASTAFYVEACGEGGTRRRVIHRFRIPNPSLDPGISAHVFVFDARREQQQDVEFRTVKRKEIVAEGIQDEKLAFKLAEILNECIAHLVLK